jgi:hypothetical protein
VAAVTVSMMAVAISISAMLVPVSPVRVLFARTGCVIVLSLF